MFDIQVNMITSLHCHRKLKTKVTDIAKECIEPIRMLCLNLQMTRTNKNAFSRNA